MDESLNVFDEAIESCSEQPLTGFFRDGCCNTSDQDVGSHTVCVQVTAEFLERVPWSLVAVFVLLLGVRRRQVG